jgi:hypothetical protein
MIVRLGAIRTPFNPMLTNKLHDAVVFVRTDDVRGEPLQRRMRILDRNGAMRDPEHSDVVEVIAEHDQLFGREVAELDERLHALGLRRARVVHLEPVPSGRIDVLEQMGLDVRAMARTQGQVELVDRLIVVYVIFV